MSEPSSGPDGPLHIPRRPMWRCRRCARRWPCEAARAALRKEYDIEGVNVTLYLAAQFSAAAVDLPAEPAGELYGRFLGWIRG